MRLGFLITARLKSERLKNKILLELNNIPIIDHIIRRCKKVSGISEVVLATSVNPQDGVLGYHAKNNNILFYPGSEDDVLTRLESAASYFDLDAFLSITADNPLFSIRASNMAIERMKSSSADFIFTKGLPMGCNVAVLKTKALRVANYMKSKTDTEIWGPYVNRKDFFNIKNISFVNSPFSEEKRLTIDYQEDYYLFKILFKEFQESVLPSTEDVLKYLETNPDLWKINAKHSQRFPSPKDLIEINTAFDEAKDEGMAFSDKIGFSINPGFEDISIPF